LAVVPERQAETAGGVESRPLHERHRLQEFRAIGLSPEADDPGLWRDWSAQA